MGGTGLTLLRWLYGYWLPPLSTLLRSRLALAYVLSSLLTGAAVTYYYDDRSNAKLNTIIRSALQLLGLYCVYHSAWTLPELAAAAVAGLVAVRLLLPLLGGRLLPARFRRRQQQQRRNNGGRRVTFNEFVEVEDYYPASAPARSTAPRFSDGTPLHLRASPPAPWTTGHAAVEARPPSSASGSKSPAGGSRGAAAAAQATPPPRINLSAELDKVSPLVKSGIILNTATGRTIKIGGAVYNKLVEQGYSPDAARGVLTPPPPATAARDGGLGSPRGQRATPAAGGSRLAPKSPRSHAISPAGSSGGATTGGGSVGSTPAAALRRRRSTSSADEFL